MSVGFIRSNFAKKVVSVVCLLVFPVAAQQANTGLSMQAVQSGSQQPGAPSTNAPEPKNLPQPTHVDYSKPSPLLPNPFARYIPRDVPPPSFTNAPKIEQLIQNGKLMLSMNDAIAIALADNLDIAICSLQPAHRGYRHSAYQSWRLTPRRQFWRGFQYSGRRRRRNQRFKRSRGRRNNGWSRRSRCWRRRNCRYHERSRASAGQF